MEQSQPSSKPAQAPPRAVADPDQQAVLIVAPLANDARLTADFLKRAGMPSRTCSDVSKLCDYVATGCGAILIAEEALNEATIPLINSCLANQPSWSDVPIVIITTGEETAPVRHRRLAAFAPSGNVSIIERPFHPETLVSALDVALRARRRQYQVRELLDQTRHDAEILAEQAAALQEADVRKNEFLAMLAHELRNPLASIANAVTLLQEAEENRDWALGVINRQTHQLTRLVDDLLDVSRITRGKIQLRKKRIDATDCLKSAAAAATVLANHRHQVFQLETPSYPLWVDADPARLEQVFVNLLTNAIKFTPHEGRIQATAGLEGGQVVVRVRDSGIGIVPEKIAGMFELFAQGERTPGRIEGGLGIGLTLVQRLCEMHNGAVAAHSDGPGTGCTFTITLPGAVAPAASANNTPAAPAATPPGGPAPANAIRVLVVDDNVDTASGLARLLSRRGYAVRIVHDGPSAIEAAGSFTPQIVLLDIGLPGMDGYEVVRRLRENPSHADCTIIAVSGYGQDQDVRASQEAGFDHHLVKPVSLDALRAIMDRSTAG